MPEVLEVWADQQTGSELKEASEEKLRALWVGLEAQESQGWQVLTRKAQREPLAAWAPQEEAQQEPPVRREELAISSPVPPERVRPERLEALPTPAE
jgi:hypothetical protein